MCVQRFDDSQSSAIRITYRISLRSSSFQKPRYPSPIVVQIIKQHQQTTSIHTIGKSNLSFRNKNDPSAGSPTETLLRLHLPLNDKIYTTSLMLKDLLQPTSQNPKCSPDHSIGRCDGRCVQRAGT